MSSYLFLCSFSVFLYSFCCKKFLPDLPLAVVLSISTHSHLASLFSPTAPRFFPDSSNSDLCPISIPHPLLFARLPLPALPLYPQSNVLKRELIFSPKSTTHMVFCGFINSSSILSSIGALSYNIISDSYTTSLQHSNRDLALLILLPRCRLPSPTTRLDIMLDFK